MKRKGLVAAAAAQLQIRLHYDRSGCEKITCVSPHYFITQGSSLAADMRLA